MVKARARPAISVARRATSRGNVLRVRVRVKAVRDLAKVLVKVLVRVKGKDGEKVRVMAKVGENQHHFPMRVIRVGK